LAKSGGFYWPSGGAGIANYVYVNNLIDAMIRAAVTAEAHGERFIVGDGAVTWREFLSPLLSPWLSEIPSYSRSEVRILAARSGPSLAETLRIISGNPELRDALRATSLGRKAGLLVRRHWPAMLATRPKGNMDAAGSERKSRCADPAP